MIIRKSFKLFFRSFLIQSLWNKEGLQNVGFAYLIMPFLRDIYKSDRERFLQALKRHLEHFVTNPYLSPGVAAMSGLREENAVLENRIDEKELSSFKRYLSASFAAIGDSLIWGCLRPINSIFGSLAYFIFAERVPAAVILASLIFYLFFYNILTLNMRYWSGLLALKYKMQFIVILKRFPLRRIRDVLCVLGLGLCVTAALYFFVKHGGDLRHKLAAMAFFSVFTALKIFNVATVTIFMFGVIAAVILKYLGI